VAANGDAYNFVRDNTASRISILLVVDIRFYREGLAEILMRHDRVDAVHTAESFQGADEVLQSAEPDVVLVDTGATDALCGLTRARRTYPSCKFVVLAARDDRDELLRCAEIGVSGYASHEDSVFDVVETILGAVTGRFSCSASAGESLLRRMSELARTRAAAPPRIPQLTPREHTVLSLMTRGLSNKQIASELTIEVSTVKNHVHHILEKCDARSRAEAVAIANASDATRV
jgi:DNA-binding NarL/FixJ family response regulator